MVHNLRCFSTEDGEKAPGRIIEIYYGSLTKRIRSLKLFSLFTSAGGLLFQPFIYMKAVESGNTEVVIGIFAIVSFFAVSTPILLNMVTKKYVTHMYYDISEDKYIANTYNLFVVRKKVFIYILLQHFSNHTHGCTHINDELYFSSNLHQKM